MSVCMANSEGKMKHLPSHCCIFFALVKEMATHSSVLAWRIPGTGEPGGLPSMGLHRVGHVTQQQRQHSLLTYLFIYSLSRVQIESYVSYFSAFVFQLMLPSPLIFLFVWPHFLFVKEIGTISLNFPVQTQQACISMVSFAMLLCPHLFVNWCYVQKFGQT